jgi:MFS transporter, DHA1 family, multidrug resistance protein
MPSAVTAASGAISSEPAVTAAFARLCVIGFLAYCSYAICRTPLLPLLAQELGATPPMVGFVVGASTLTGIVLKLPAGAWSDLLGRRPLLVLGTIVFATMPFTYLGVASLGALIAVRFVHGAATAIFGPVASASLSDVAPPARRATWLSTYSTVQGVGQALGPVVAGYLIAVRRYDLAFLAAGLFAAATPFIAARWPRSTPPLASTRRTTHLLRSIVDVCRHPLILLTSLTQAAQFILNGTLNAFLPLFAHDVLGLGASQLGWLFALQTVTTLATRPVMGMVSDRIGRRSVIVTGLSLCSSAVWSVSLVDGPAGLVMAVVAYAVGVAVTTAATSAFITDLSHRAQYGAAHGVFGSIYDVGDALGPIAAGVLVATLGYPHMFRIMAMVGFTISMVFLIATRTHPVRDVTQETR